MTNRIQLPPALVHNVVLRRFEMRVSNDLAYLSYTDGSGCVSFDHTHVPESLRGKGIAAALVRGALKAARQQHWKIDPRCSYVAAYIERNTEFSDLTGR
jgi:predicted GNAT family acetyltransferase